MDRSYFVSEAFTFALNEYLNNKNNPEGVRFNSFYAVVIRQLVSIYDELDIVNPYYFKNENTLFNNMKKYGYTEDGIKKFFETLSKYYDNETSDGFVFIQKCLIDMFIKKNLSIDLSDIDKRSFRTLVYSPYCSNPLMVSYNFMMTKKPTEVLEYLDKCLEDNPKKKPARPKETLNLEAYEILKYSLDDIKSMNSDELDEVNKKVYNYFEINANAINKDYLLDKAIYDYNHPKGAFSTGNGYVDILFVLSIIATIAMVLIVVTLLFL